MIRSCSALHIRLREEPTYNASVDGDRHILRLAKSFPDENED